MILLEAVTKTYGTGPPAVAGLSLEIEAGETCVLVGPSGCGKTTTMKMINRLVEPTSGRVLVDGQDVAGVDAVELRRGMGYVIQQVGLFPHLSVGDNVGTVPRLLGWDRARVRAGWTSCWSWWAWTRPSIATAGPINCPADSGSGSGWPGPWRPTRRSCSWTSPSGPSTRSNRRRLQEEFIALQAALRKTVVLVTHDIDEAVRLGDRLAVLAEGGTLAQHGTPAEVLARPASAFVAGFVGAGATLKRLGVMAVTDALDPDAGPDGHPDRASVPATASLAEATEALLAAPVPAVTVVEGTQHLGVVTLASIQSALRRQAAGDDENGAEA